MKNLNPEELLEFFKNIKEISDIIIQEANIEADLPSGKTCNIKIKFNNIDVIIWLFLDLTEKISSFHYCGDSTKATLIAKQTLFEEIDFYFENDYKEWIYNTTGYNISDNFSKLIIEEIERIQNLFE